MRDSCVQLNVYLVDLSFATRRKYPPKQYKEYTVTKESNPLNIAISFLLVEQYKEYNVTVDTFLPSKFEFGFTV
jgi:hypothetical protein